MPKTKPYKAIGAFFVAFLSAFVLLTSDKTNFSDLTPLQWTYVVASAIISAYATWQIPNPPADPRHRRATN